MAMPTNPNAKSWKEWLGGGRGLIVGKLGGIQKNKWQWRVLNVDGENCTYCEPKQGAKLNTFNLRGATVRMVDSKSQMHRNFEAFKIESSHPLKKTLMSKTFIAVLMPKDNKFVFMVEEVDAKHWMMVLNQKEFPVPVVQPKPPPNIVTAIAGNTMYPAPKPIPVNTTPVNTTPVTPTPVSTPVVVTPAAQPKPVVISPQPAPVQVTPTVVTAVATPVVQQRVTVTPIQNQPQQFNHQQQQGYEGDDYNYPQGAGEYYIDEYGNEYWEAYDNEGYENGFYEGEEYEGEMQGEMDGGLNQQFGEMHLGEGGEYYGEEGEYYGEEGEYYGEEGEYYGEEQYYEEPNHHTPGNQNHVGY